MDTLRLVDKRVEKHTELYEIVSDISTEPDIVSEQRPMRMKQYIVSTPQTRKVCTQSELIDFVLDGPNIRNAQFRYILPDGIRSAILDTSLSEMLQTTWGGQKTETGRKRHIDIFQIMRGGLNFDPADIIWELRYGAKTQSMMLQRFKTDSEGNGWATFSTDTRKIFEKEGPEHVRKLHFMIGDIVASGASLYDGLLKLLNRIEEKHDEFRTKFQSDARYSIGSITFFTIGSIRTEEMLAKALSEYAERGLFAEGSVANVVYLEGRFGVAEEGVTDIPHQKKGTDLYPGIGRGTIIAPLFEWDWLSKPYFPLEACVIYDGGSRRCDPEFALEDVIHHFRTMRSYAVEHHETLHEALRKRIPFLDSNTVEEWRAAHPAWTHEAVSDGLIKAIIERKNRTLAEYPDTHEEILKVYDQRLEYLESLR